MEAILFQSSERLVYREEGMRTLTIRPMANEHTDLVTQFPAFRQLSENTLDRSARYERSSMDCETIVFIPVAGRIMVESSPFNGFLDAGQILMIRAEKNTGIRILHADREELVQWIELRLLDSTEADTGPVIHNLDLEVENELQSFPIGRHHELFFGKFRGRKDGWFVPEGRNALFVYLIHGAVEFAKRLLEGGDGLALYSLQGRIEFESLANESIILILANQEQKNRI